MVVRRSILPTELPGSNYAPWCQTRHSPIPGNGMLSGDRQNWSGDDIEIWSPR